MATEIVEDSSSLRYIVVTDDGNAEVIDEREYTDLYRVFKYDYKKMLIVFPDKSDLYMAVITHAFGQRNYCMECLYGINSKENYEVARNALERFWETK